MADPVRTPTSADIADAPADILFVCTANVCRSPMAEFMARSILASNEDQPGRQVRSAGTNAAVGAPIHGLAEEVLAKRGISGRKHAARQVDDSMVRSSGLVLCATREQRTWMVEQFPFAIRRIFTLRHFAMLTSLGRMEAPEIRTTTTEDLLELASAGRVRLQPLSDDDDSVKDPVLGKLADFEQCARTIWSALNAIFGPEIE